MTLGLAFWICMLISVQPIHGDHVCVAQAIPVFSPI